MNVYIGTKAVKARPMTRGEYNIVRGWEIPKDEDPADPGYLVEYMDGGRANVPGYAGYVSWSPHEVFEKAYKPVGGGMNFGDALTILKGGGKVARAGWNGKGMWLVLVPGTKSVNFMEGSPYQNAGLAQGDILPHIDMYTVNADGRRAMLPGWLASQSDMLADDWVMIV